MKMKIDFSRLRPVRLSDRSFFEEKIDEIAVLAYEDQCSPANPRVPMVDDMKEIIRKAYQGN